MAEVEIGKPIKYRSGCISVHPVEVDGDGRTWYKAGAAKRSGAPQGWLKTKRGQTILFPTPEAALSRARKFLDDVYAGKVQHDTI